MEKQTKVNNVCNICPRRCNVVRGKIAGFCKQTNKLRISKVMLHHFEEPCISGALDDKGSGAIFFTGCNLRCVFCQNYKISQQNKGKNITTKKLVSIFKKLERLGALNINLVSPTHFSDQIIEALDLYRPNIPIVWNSGGYETQETIKRLKGLVDIYLVDMKYASDQLALKYSRAADYVANNRQVILEMVSQQPKNIFQNGLMKKGVIIRHLILPSHTADSIECLNFVAKNIGKSAIVSLMSQYEPQFKAVEFPEINRKITPLEYKRVVNHALSLGMENCYTQDLSSADSRYTPKF